MVPVKWRRDWWTCRIFGPARKRPERSLIAGGSIGKDLTAEEQETENRLEKTARKKREKERKKMRKKKEKKKKKK